MASMSGTLVHRANGQEMRGLWSRTVRLEAAAFRLIPGAAARDHREDDLYQEPRDSALLRRGSGGNDGELSPQNLRVSSLSQPISTKLLRILSPELNESQEEFLSMRTLVLALGALICFGTVAEAEIASYYGKEHAGKRTASGERFNPSAMTAAHRSLRFGTRVKVTNKRNGRSVVVRINDRGPFVKGRSIDLSHAAAKQIAMGGSAQVSLQVLR